MMLLCLISACYQIGYEIYDGLWKQNEDDHNRCRKPQQNRAEDIGFAVAFFGSPMPIEAESNGKPAPLSLEAKLGTEKNHKVAPAVRQVISTAGRVPTPTTSL
jgi:hypothetical protein